MWYTGTLFAKTIQGFTNKILDFGSRALVCGLLAQFSAQEAPWLSAACVVAHCQMLHNTCLSILGAYNG